MCWKTAVVVGLSAGLTAALRAAISGVITFNLNHHITLLCKASLPDKYVLSLQPTFNHTGLQTVHFHERQNGSGITIIIRTMSFNRLSRIFFRPVNVTIVKILIIFSRQLGEATEGLVLKRTLST